jgi:hypothetical protein
MAANSLAVTNEFLSDLNHKRQPKSVGFNNIRMVERLGGCVLEPTAFPPDPNTHRHEYYYNAITNALYRKVIIIDANGNKAAHWKKASN